MTATQVVEDALRAYTPPGAVRAVGALVRRGVKSVGTIDWAGPFPDRLPVTFNRMAA